MDAVSPADSDNGFGVAESVKPAVVTTIGADGAEVTVFQLVSPE